MPKAYISEYERIGNFFGTELVVVKEPALVEQTVTFSTATQSNAFNAKTRVIRVHTDSVCSILVGSNPTATTNSKRLAANQTEYFSVAAGDKISIISNT